MEWTCACGRKLDGKQCWCFECGATSPKVADPDSAQDILIEGSIRLTRKYDIAVHIQRLGGMESMSVDEARELVAETERDILDNLEELRFG